MAGNAGMTFSSGGENSSALRHIVGRNYFETSGIRILRGREFRKEDQSGDTAPVIVSQELVRKIWNGADALGRRVEIGNGEVAPALGALPGTFDLRGELLGASRHRP